MPIATNLVAPTRVATSYARAVAITPTDGTPIGPYAALYVGGTGDVTLYMTGYDGVTDNVLTFKAVPVGTLLPIAFQGVNATGTTATNLIGLG